MTSTVGRTIELHVIKRVLAAIGTKCRPGCSVGERDTDRTIPAVMAVWIPRLIAVPIPVMVVVPILVVISVIVMIPIVVTIPVIVVIPILVTVPIMVAIPVIVMISIEISLFSVSLLREGHSQGQKGHEDWKLHTHFGKLARHHVSLFQLTQTCLVKNKFKLLHII